MSVALIRYDAARRAIACAYRVDEVKAIRNKAEAVRVYAKQAGDYQLQNQAAEIRLFAERRAGQLLSDMAKNPGTRGEGRPRGDGTKIRRSSSATAYPPRLDDLGVSKNQSSKWQRLAKLIDDATFERALARAKERHGELTTAAVLCKIRHNSGQDTATFGEQLSSDFREFPSNGKCHQRVIRERMAEQPEPEIAEKRRLATDFKNAVVREISYAEAKNVPPRRR